MYLKKALKKLPWEKVAIATAALVLLAASVWFGDRSVNSGNLARSVDLKPRVTVGELLRNAAVDGRIAYGVNDFVTNVTMTPSSHFTYASRSILSINYTLVRPVNKLYISVVDRAGRMVSRIDSPASRGVGSYPATWNGTGVYTDVNGVVRDGDVPPETYYLVFAAEQENSVIFPVYVEQANGGNNGAGVFNNAYALPATINADSNEASHVYLTLTRPANVTVEVFAFQNSATPLVTLIQNSYRSVLGQQEIVAWKGRLSGDMYNDNATFQRAPAGLYQVKITARDPSNLYSQEQYLPVTVNRTGANGQFHVMSLTKYPDSLDTRSNSGSIRFSYTLNGVPSTMTAAVYETTGNRLVANLVPTGTCNSFVAVQGSTCTYYADWNGVDRYTNTQAYSGNYKFKIDATSSVYGSESSEIAFQVLSNNVGGVYGPFNPNGGYNPYDPNYNNGNYNGYQARCGNIADVTANDPLCPAIQFAMSRGFMAGYPDGGVHLKDTIKRGEFLAVIASAFKYNVEQYAPFIDGNLGYRDLIGNENQWYMKYLKTFTRIGIMTGYPDRTMKPEKTMTTAELYVSLFKAAIMSPNRVARFNLAQLPYGIGAPYSDTPIEMSTQWYILHAQFAKQYGLVTGTKFNPAKGITRGQVVKLIYDMYQKGLLAL